MSVQLSKSQGQAAKKSGYIAKSLRYVAKYTKSVEQSYTSKNYLTHLGFKTNCYCQDLCCSVYKITGLFFTCKMEQQLFCLFLFSVVIRGLYSWSFLGGFCCY